MNRNAFRKTLACLCLLAAFSCEKDEEVKFNSQDGQDISEEAVIEGYFQDIDDIGAVSLEAPSDTEYSGGRVSSTITIQDNRLNCNGVVVTVVTGSTSTADNPYGSITVDFGTTGCTDVKGNVRKGTLIFSYTGRRFYPGSKVIVTPQNYSINGITLEGTRTSTNLATSRTETPQFHVTLEDGKATFPDGSVAYRSSGFIWSLIRGATRADDQLIVDADGIATGVTRNGRSYIVNILEDLVYKRFCGMAVAGVKKYTIDTDKEITVDYGDGTCDKTLDVTFNGTSKTITLD